MSRATFTARLIGAGTFAGVITLAACSDSPMSPKTAVAPTDANAITIVKTPPPPLATYLTVRVADTLGVTLKETGWVRFTSTNPADSVDVMDNSANDLDPTVGYVKAKMGVAESYKACFSFSDHFVGDRLSVAFPWCATKMSSLLTVNLGVVYGKRTPTIVMLAKNEFGNLVAGAKYTIEIPDQKMTMTATEGGFEDESVVPGNLTFGTVHYEHLGVKVCEVSPPPKHELTSSKCLTFDTKFGVVKTLTFKHQSILY